MNAVIRKKGARTVNINLVSFGIYYDLQLSQKSQLNLIYHLLCGSKVLDNIKWDAYVHF